MGTIADKLNYLNQTKTQLKEILNKLGAEILDNATFRSYLTHLDNLYNGLYNLTDLSKNGIVGRTIQDGTPTPTTPIEIEDLSGEITYSVGSKNLFSSIMELGSIDNTTGETTTNNSCIRTKDFISVRPNTTYTINNDRDYRIIIYEYEEDKSYIQYDKHTLTPKTFTTQNNTYFIKVRSSDLHSKKKVDTNYMMEYGSTASQIEPYIPKQDFLINLDGDGYNIHLDKTDMYEDVIYSKDNKFYLYKGNNNIILNGSEDWEKGSITSIDRFSILLEDAIYGIPQFISKNAISNYFPYNYPYMVAPTENTFHLDHGGSNITNLSIDYTTYGTTTLEQWKTWLSTHNLIVYYALKTPTTTEITSTSHPTLYNQLKEIQDYLIKYKVNNELILGYGEPNIKY